MDKKLAERLQRREHQPPGGDPEAAAQAAKDAPPVPRFDEWMEREIPKPDLLCGTWLSTTSRVLITGPTGLGKTMLGVALVLRTASAADFLHWDAGREACILYVDGEMSRREMQRRLRDEAKRSGLRPNALYVLSKEDFEGMPPLNTEAGQAWMNVKLDEVNPELAIFDNIQSLIVGDQTEKSWSPVLPWMRSLTRRHIGQIWLHHTGHNEGHSYGTKTREWQMDTCILMKRVNDDDSDDLTFSLEFTKARERTPENKEEFESVTITLRNDRWEITKGGSAGKKGKSIPEPARIALAMLKKAVAEAGEKPPGSNHIPAQARIVRISLWQKYCETGSITKGETEDAFRKAFERAATKLQALDMVGVWEGYAWPL